MAHLEEITVGCQLNGIAARETVTVIAVQWYGNAALEVTFKNSRGQLGSQILYRGDEATVDVLGDSLPWSFGADADKMRLVSEAYRIHLAHLFDPYLAVHTSAIQPLPHQITAVYQEMLPRLPLRYILADDPGAGKTIMTGLFIKELIARGDLKRCLIVTPGNLAEQWQDELFRKFHLRFEVLTNDRIESAVSGNIFTEMNFCIARLDKLSRSEALQEKLRITDWDLIVCDEAHKMSATVWGGEIKYTKRFNLGRLLSEITRNFLLLTATPHNGKNEDFQLFLSLVDPDRFEGAARSSNQSIDVSDVMRRLVKEELLKFDGTPLFPERRAYTVNYDLSPAEGQLYSEVTSYVQEEFNRAENLNNDRKATVGFALTILQRRLASSPEAIYQSLHRRRERLEHILAEEKLGKPDTGTQFTIADDFDEDDFSADELEQTEENVTDRASAASTIREMEAEISTLKRLEQMANAVRVSGVDRKWDERRKVEELFKQDPEVRILIATDAAGEGINLQRAHLMINYDLPWNPNRLEQRFGRIHRIGQTEVCHLWNLVSAQTREGMVFQRLFQKLEEERGALGGKVFDILGKMTFDNKPLRELLIEAVRYGNDPAVRARLQQVVDNSLDQQKLRELLDERALTDDTMDVQKVSAIREEMERMEAHKLQPHFIEAFFLEAFRSVGGKIRPRETGRYEITFVPAAVRSRDMQIGFGEPVLQRYERVCFEKERCNVQGMIPAELLCPGHPLLEAVIDLVRERNAEVLKQGTIFVDDSDDGTDPRLLFYIEDAIQDGVLLPGGTKRIISQHVHFVELKEDGTASSAGYAPYLDYRAPTEAERTAALPYIQAQDWLKHDVENRARGYAIAQLLPQHFAEVKARKQKLLDKTAKAVKERLTAEIQYWDYRAADLKQKEAAGKPNARLNSQMAARRAEELASRMQKRLAELETEKLISPAPPVVVGGALVLPGGLLRQLMGTPQPTLFSQGDKRAIELVAMNAVMQLEQAFGYLPRDVSAQKVGYDVESTIPPRLRSGEACLRFIEVKGRAKGAQTVTVSKNEILTGLNKPEEFLLAIVEVDGAHTHTVYLKRPFRNPPDFTATSVNFDIRDLVQNAEVVYKT